MREFTRTIGQIERGEDTILTSSVLASYAARIPKLPPLDHFANLLTLCVDNGTGNPLDSRIVAPHEGDTCHVNVRVMVRDHVINERLFKTVLLSKFTGDLVTSVGIFNHIH